MATISPVAPTIRLLTGVKASIIGVNRTPPPMPAITAITAMAKLRRKKPKTKSEMLLNDSPSGGVSAPLVMSIKATKDSRTTAHMTITSSQGDRSSAFLFIFFMKPCL
jgi:hypothetical protein